MCQQGLMVAPLDEVALLHKKDPVCVSDGRQVVGDGVGGAVAEHLRDKRRDKENARYGYNQKCDGNYIWIPIGF